MEIIIKEANLDDLNELMKWRMKVLDTVFGINSLEEYRILFDQNEKYYKEAIPTGHHIAVFAEVNGKKVGCGGMCLFDEMPSPDNLTGTCAYLMNIYTPEKYRDHGVARHVVKYLVSKALNMGIGKIYLETTEEARNLYQSLGFKELNDYLILGETNERDN